MRVELISRKIKARCHWCLSSCLPQTRATPASRTPNALWIIGLIFWAWATAWVDIIIQTRRKKNATAGCLRQQFLPLEPNKATFGRFFYLLLIRRQTYLFCFNAPCLSADLVWAIGLETHNEWSFHFVRTLHMVIQQLNIQSQVSLCSDERKPRKHCCNVQSAGVLCACGVVFLVEHHRLVLLHLFEFLMSRPISPLCWYINKGRMFLQAGCWH